MGRTLPILAAVLATLGAGCLNGPADTPAAPSTDPLDVLGWTQLGGLIFQPGHDHTDRVLHQEVARGLTVAAQGTLAGDGPALGKYIEADVEGDLIAVGVVTGTSADMRVVLLDATALPELRVLGSFDEPDAYGDAKLDPGVPYAYLPGAAPVAFAIWDVADPGAPERLGDAPGGPCHMLHPMNVDGVPYVWCATVGGALTYRIESLPDGSARGVPVSTTLLQDTDIEVARYLDYYQAISPLGPVLTVTPHDMTAQPDPLDGTPLVVDAFELQGIRVYDVTDPLVPVEISAWRGEGMDETLHRVHTAGLFEWQGRRIGVGTTETFSEVPPALYIVDFTDWDAPRFLARWVPPGIEHDDGLAYSLHNWQFVDGRLYVTAFHAGMWVLDLADPAAPREVALRVPVWDTAYPLAGIEDYNRYWDVIVTHGYALLTDMAAGVEVVHVDGDPAGDPSWTGFT